MLYIRVYICHMSYISFIVPFMCLWTIKNWTLPRKQASRWRCSVRFLILRFRLVRSGNFFKFFPLLFSSIRSSVTRVPHPHSLFHSVLFPLLSTTLSLLNWKNLIEFMFLPHYKVPYVRDRTFNIGWPMRCPKPLAPKPPLALLVLKCGRFEWIALSKFVSFFFADILRLEHIIIIIILIHAVCQWK